MSSVIKLSLDEDLPIQEAREYLIHFFIDVVKLIHNPPTTTSVSPATTISNHPTILSLTDQTKNLEQELLNLKTKTLLIIPEKIDSITNDLNITNERIDKYDSRFHQLESLIRDGFNGRLASYPNHSGITPSSSPIPSNAIVLNLPSQHSSGRSLPNQNNDPAAILERISYIKVITDKTRKSPSHKPK